jgi:kynurenine formamidase
MVTHCGTHVDAPVHFDLDGPKINEMPVETFISSAVVLNLSHKRLPKGRWNESPLPTDDRITAADMDEALKKTGETIKSGDMVLIYTGQDEIIWGEYDKTGKSSCARASGMTKTGQDLGGYLRANTGYSEDFVDWIVNHKVKIFGNDTSPTDWPFNGPVHIKLLGKHHITHYENLCNLDKIKKSRVLFIGLPLKIRGGTGSPVRAIAVEDFDLQV